MTRVRTPDHVALEGSRPLRSAGERMGRWESRIGGWRTVPRKAPGITGSEKRGVSEDREAGSGMASLREIFEPPQRGGKRAYLFEEEDSEILGWTGLCPSNLKFRVFLKSERRVEKSCEMDTISI